MDRTRSMEETKKQIDQIIERIQDKLSKIRVKLLVLSGKGGVGKTFVATSLALYLKKRGYSVGLYDADETGAVDPYVLGERNASIYKDEETGELIPITTRHGIKLLSIEPLLPSDSTPLVWMGPLRSRFLMETLGYTKWGVLDFLVVDMPPGTGDEAITLAQVTPPPRYAIIVSSPGILATSVVKKAIVFANKMNIPILGIIENMSYFTCPGGEKTYPLGTPTIHQLAEQYDITPLGQIPLNPKVRISHDTGQPIYLTAPDSEIDRELNNITDKIIGLLKEKGVL